MLRPEEYRGKGFLHASQQWQRVIDTVAQPKEKDLVGLAACKDLRLIARENGSPKVLVRSFRALVLDKVGQPDWDDDVVVEFSKVIATGWLGRISYLAFNHERSITWPLYDVQVFNTTETDVMIDDIDELPPPYLPTNRFAGPVHLPVGYIDFAVYAA